MPSIPIRSLWKSLTASKTAKALKSDSATIKEASDETTLHSPFFFELLSVLRELRRRAHATKEHRGQKTIQGENVS